MFDGSAEDALAAWDRSQLEHLAVELAEQLAATSAPPGAIPMGCGLSGSEPDRLCDQACRAAAQLFGVPVERLTEPDRRRSVVDARVVAQSAVRECGLSLQTIGSFFGQHHAPVSIDKVANTPRLCHAAARLREHLLAQYGGEAA